MTPSAQILIRATVVGGSSSGLSGLTRPGRTRRVASMRLTRAGDWIRITVAEADRALRTGRITVWGEEYAAVDANAPAKPVAPTHTSLLAACEQITDPALRESVGYLLDAARVNADDSLTEGSTEPWEDLFRSSLEFGLANFREATEAAREWFKRHGVAF